MAENSIATFPQWPEDVAKVDVIAPRVIMRQVAQQLKERTKGLLEAEVLSTVQENHELHEFFIIAPTLDRYRYRLFRVLNKKNLVYPSEIAFDEASFVTSSQIEFNSGVTRILNSDTTKSIIHSLIARINELNLSDFDE